MGRKGGKEDWKGEREAKGGDTEGSRSFNKLFEYLKILSAF